MSTNETDPKCSVYLDFFSSININKTHLLGTPFDSSWCTGGEWRTPTLISQHQPRVYSTEFLKKHKGIPSVW